MVADVTNLKENDNDDISMTDDDRKERTRRINTRVVKAVKPPKKINTSVGFWIKCRTDAYFVDNSILLYIYIYIYLKDVVNNKVH